jgi:hypothetical protein
MLPDAPCYSLLLPDLWERVPPATVSCLKPATPPPRTPYPRGSGLHPRQSCAQRHLRAEAPPIPPIAVTNRSHAPPPDVFAWFDLCNHLSPKNPCNAKRSNPRNPCTRFQIHPTEHAPRTTPPPHPSRHSKRHHRLLRVQPILRLVIHHRVHPINHLVRNLQVPVGRQAVHV